MKRQEGGRGRGEVGGRDGRDGDRVKRGLDREAGASRH